jgi:hypothetical protein
MKIVVKFVLLLFSFTISAQDSVLERQGMFGECFVNLISVNASLNLYEKPNLESENKQIIYGENWLISYKTYQAKTRVIAKGKIKALKNLQLEYCIPKLASEKSKITIADEIDYLHYTGEGYGQVLVNDSQCSAEVHEKLGVFKVIKFPEVQVWIKVLNADGTSPGWLFHDGTQTKNGKLEC